MPTKDEVLRNYLYEENIEKLSKYPPKYLLEYKSKELGCFNGCEYNAICEKNGIQIPEQLKERKQKALKEIENSDYVEGVWGTHFRLLGTKEEVENFYSPINRRY